MSTSTENKSVKVLFPCVHGLASGQLITINCFHSAELKGTIKAVTGADEEIARRIIGASRFNESDARAGIGVMALFSNPLFSGESYGLALAVADKLARFEALREWTEIYATGAVPPDGCGQVDAINSFKEKINLLVEEAQPGSLFLYPKSNLSPSFDKIQEKLNLLYSKGVDCIAVASVNDLQGKLWRSNVGGTNQPAFKNKLIQAEKIPAAIWQTIFGLALAGIAFFLVYLIVSAPKTASVPDLAGTAKHEKLIIAKEVNEPFSHQEKKQKGRDTDSNMNLSKALPHDLKQEKQNESRQPQKTILESTDTDSSLY